MKNTRLTAFAVLTAFAATALMPMAAFAGPKDRQKKKNNWRNAAVGAGAVAGYGLLKGNKTATVLGAAGAAYSAKRYEEERHNQSKRKSARQHRRNYTEGDRHYYHYQGHLYYMENGQRHRVK